MSESSPNERPVELCSQFKGQLRQLAARTKESPYNPVGEALDHQSRRFPEHRLVDLASQLHLRLVASENAPTYRAWRWNSSERMHTGERTANRI